MAGGGGGMQGEGKGEQGSEKERQEDKPHCEPAQTDPDIHVFPPTQVPQTPHALTWCITVFAYTIGVGYTSPINHASILEIDCDTIMLSGPLYYHEKWYHVPASIFSALRALAGPRRDERSGSSEIVGNSLVLSVSPAS